MKMTSFLFALLLSFVVIDCLDQTKDCPSDKSNAASLKLRHNLFCGYEKTIRPVFNHKIPVHLALKMTLMYFAYDISTNTFNVDGYIYMLWNDEHLEWDPLFYDFIDMIRLPSNELWVPDLSVFNQRISSGNPVIIVDLVPCTLDSNGDVFCVVPIHLNIFCFGDLTNYPFDTQNCTITVGSWVHKGEDINISLYGSTTIDTETTVPNGDWALIGKEAILHTEKYMCCPDDSYPSINFSFKIRRLAGAHAASVILPALALIVITLISLWLPPDHSNRLSLCCVNLLCEFLYLQHVCFLIPVKGEKVPLILFFARDSLLLSVFAVVFTVILKNMIDNVKPAPDWMTRTVSILTASKVGRFILSNRYAIRVEENSEIINSNLRKEDWHIFAKILDRLCFALYLVVYLFLYFRTVWASIVTSD